MGGHKYCQNSDILTVQNIPGEIWHVSKHRESTLTCQILPWLVTWELARRPPHLYTFVTSRSPISSHFSSCSVHYPFILSLFSPFPSAPHFFPGWDGWVQHAVGFAAALVLLRLSNFLWSWFSWWKRRRCMSPCFIDASRKVCRGAGSCSVAVRRPSVCLSHPQQQRWPASLLLSAPRDKDIDQ